MNYFPIIRGKLYDLAAVTQLVADHQLPNTVTPIIEPVKDIAGVTKATSAMAHAAHPGYVIQNPQVGNYQLLAAPRHLAVLSHTVQPARIFDAQPAALVIATTAAQAKLLPKRQLALVPDEARVRQLALPHAVYLNDHFTVYPYTDDYGILQDEFYQYAPPSLPGIGFADYRSRLALISSMVIRNVPSQSILFTPPKMARYDYIILCRSIMMILLIRKLSFLKSWPNSQLGCRFISMPKQLGLSPSWMRPIAIIFLALV